MCALRKSIAWTIYFFFFYLCSFIFWCVSRRRRRRLRRCRFNCSLLVGASSMSSKMFMDLSFSACEWFKLVFESTVWSFSDAFLCKHMKRDGRGERGDGGMRDNIVEHSFFPVCIFFFCVPLCAVWCILKPNTMCSVSLSLVVHIFLPVRSFIRSFEIKKSVFTSHSF